MRLSSVALRGVTRFTASDPISVDLEGLGPGLVAVVGPNGAGKTTILEAAIAALYRSFPTRPGWYEHFSGRDAFIEATFEDDDGLIVDVVKVRTAVDAEARKTEQYVFVNGKSVTTGRAKEAEAFIEKRFGSLSLILASVFAAQNKAGNFLTLPKRDRKALMVELLGLSRLDVLHESAKEHRDFASGRLDVARARVDGVELELSDLDALEARRNTLSGTLAQVEAEVSRVRGQEADAASRLERAKVLAEQTEKLKARLSSAERDLDVARKDLRAAELQPKLIGDAAEHKLELVNAIDPDAMEQHARRRHSAALAELDARQARLETTIARRGEIAEAGALVEKLVAEVAELELAHNGAAEALAAVKVAEADLKREDAIFSDKTTRHWEDLGRLERQSESLSKVPCIGVGSLPEICPLLGDAREAQKGIAALEAPSGKDVAGAKRTLELAQAAATVATGECDPAGLDDMCRQLTKARGVAALSETLTRAEAELAEVGKARDTAESALDGELAGIAAARERVATERERIEAEKMRDLLEAEQAISAAATRLGEVEHLFDRAQREYLDSKQVDIGLAGSEYETAFTRRESVEAALRRTDQELAGVQAQIEQLEKKKRSLKSLRADAAMCEEAAGDWGLLAQALGRDGIQALEIDAAGPEVARLTNELLEACYGPRFGIAFETLREKKSSRGEFSEVFDVRVFDHGADRVVEALSGGERVVVGEAIGLALAIFNARRSGVRWRTLFRDETAGALDPVNAIAYVDMLRRALALGGFDQVVFVSHSVEVCERADARVAVEGGRVAGSGGVSHREEVLA